MNKIRSFFNSDTLSFGSNLNFQGANKNRKERTYIFTRNFVQLFENYSIKYLLNISDPRTKIVSIVKFYLK